MRPETLQKVVLSCASLLVTTFATDLTLHYTHAFGAATSWTRPDERLGYTFIPGAEYWLLGGDGRAIHGRINSHGWRDQERSIRKPQGVRRIAVLGDSFVEGLQVESERTFCALAEQSLTKELGYRVEFMNLGRSGYSPSEEISVLKEQALRYSPDVVILFFFPGNDISDLRRETAFDTRRPFFFAAADGSLQLDTSYAKTVDFRLRSIASTLRSESALFALVSDRYRRYQVARRLERRARASSSPIPSHLTLCTSHPEVGALEAYELAKRLIEQMAEACKKAGVDLVLVCCDMALRPEDESRYLAADPSFDIGFYEEDLRRFAESNALQYLGFQSVFAAEQKRTGRSLHFQRDGHWDHEGHELVARTLANRAKEWIAH